MPPWSSYSASIVCVRRELGAAVLEDAEQHGPRGDVVRLGRGVAVVGLVERDVRDVGLAAAGHRDVEVLPRRRRGDDDVRRVDGDALGTVRGDGVPEVEVFRDVLREAAPPCPVGAGPRRSTTTEPSRRMSVIRQRSPFFTHPPADRPDASARCGG